MCYIWQIPCYIFTTLLCTVYCRALWSLCVWLSCAHFIVFVYAFSQFHCMAASLTCKMRRTSPNFTLAVSKLCLFTLDFTAATPFVMRFRLSWNFSLLIWYSASNRWWLFIRAFPLIISLMAARKLIADSEDEQAFTKDSADSGPGCDKLIRYVKSYFPSVQSLYSTNLIIQLKYLMN